MMTQPPPWGVYYGECLRTLSVKKFFLISSLNLPWPNLRLFPLVLSASEKRPTTLSLQSFFRYLKRARSPLNLLFPRLNSSSSSSLSFVYSLPFLLCQTEGNKIGFLDASNKYCCGKKVSCVTLEHYITVDGGFSLFYLIAFCLLMYNQ